jgi:hypothetical protein
VGTIVAPLIGIYLRVSAESQAVAIVGIRCRLRAAAGAKPPQSASGGLVAASKRNVAADNRSSLASWRLSSLCHIEKYSAEVTLTDKAPSGSQSNGTAWAR